MAETPSTMLALGSKAASFELHNVHDIGAHQVSANQIAGPVGMMVVFICNHCPYVIKIAHALGQFSREYRDSGIGLAAINSNDAKRYPADSTDNMALFAAENRFEMPYLYDEFQTVARAYRAACTPDFFLFDSNLVLVYRGQFDRARPGNQIVSNGEDLRAAVDALIEGNEITNQQVASVGCSIKWKQGNEPDYF